MTTKPKDEDEEFRRAMTGLGVEPLAKPERAPRSEPLAAGEPRLETVANLEAAGNPEPVENPEPAAGRAPRGQVEPQEIFGLRDPDAEDEALFHAAMAELARPPDKDAPAIPTKTRGPSRRKLLRRQRSIPDDHLDLHGLTGEEALLALERFIARARRQGLRTVLVVTGKGHHSPDGRPVLKRLLGDWLRRDAGARVRAYSLAPPQLGGNGAMLLHLRARR